MGTLADRIDSLPTQNRHLEDWSNTRTAWLAGFDTGLYEAANLAKEADELMDRMLAALEDCAREDADGLDAAMAKDTVVMYYEWKERTK